MKRRKIFVDSDVAISSLLSSKGAAYFLLNEVNLELYISNISIREIKRGVNKLDLDNEKFQNLLKKRLKEVKLKEDNEGIEKIKATFKDYVFDEDDAHIVAGASISKARLILTYNIKHFKIEKMKHDLSMIVTTPAKFLQYLRSLE